MVAAGLLPAPAAAQPAPAPNLKTRQTFVTPGETPTSFDDIAHYNNFYEFGTDKLGPSRNGGGLQTSPWTLKVSGLVKKPQVYELDQPIRQLPLEERNNRMRGVKHRSTVIPWVGVAVRHRQ